MRERLVAIQELCIQDEWVRSSDILKIIAHTYSDPLQVHRHCPACQTPDKGWRRRRPRGLTTEEEIFRWYMPGKPPPVGCWYWSGKPDGAGYGRFHYQGHDIGAH